MLLFKQKITLLFLSKMLMLHSWPMRARYGVSFFSSMSDLFPATNSFHMVFFFILNSYKRHIKVCNEGQNKYIYLKVCFHKSALIEVMPWYQWSNKALLENQWLTKIYCALCRHDDLLAYMQSWLDVIIICTVKRFVTWFKIPEMACRS